MPRVYANKYDAASTYVQRLFPDLSQMEQRWKIQEIMRPPSQGGMLKELIVYQLWEMDYHTES